MTTELKPKYGEIRFTSRVWNWPIGCGQYFCKWLDVEGKCTEKVYVFTPESWQKEAEELLREGWAAARKAYSDSMNPRRDFVIRDEDLSDCHFFEYPDFDSFLKSRK